jgi:beta-phosphoglucomutase
MVQISPKAFFFDFDGVICDTEKLHMLAALYVLKPHEIKFTENYYFEKLFGYDDKGLFEHLFESTGQKLNKETLKQLITEKNTVFMDQIESAIIYFDGVVELIQSLHAKSIPLAVVSGALSQEVEACLKKGKLDRYFQFTVCADNVSRSKPHPECYMTAYQKMLANIPGLLPDDCWAIEDSPMGIESAVGAGLNVIGITNTTAAPVLSVADYVIDHYREIEIKTP